MVAAATGIAAGAILAALFMSYRSRRPGETTRALRPAAAAPAAARSDEILDALEEGVLVFDDVMTPVTLNRAARSILGLGMDPLPARLPHDELLSVARRSLTSNERVENTVELAAPAKATVLVRAAPRPGGDGVVVTLRDTSREETVQRMRRQFVNHASHELKTPVASIRTLAEAIHDAVRHDREAGERLSERLITEAQRLGDLIRDLLELARVEDPGTIASRSVDLSAVALNEANELAEVAATKAISIQQDVAPGIAVRGDANQLALMVRNLLDNAIRYSEPGASVELGVRRDAGEALITVVDEGIGIPLKDQARVFERFYRVDEARSRERGGTGLGLAIVKHVAGLHGGRVSVRSAVGEGSIFTAALPALDAEKPADLSTAPETLDA